MGHMPIEAAALEAAAHQDAAAIAAAAADAAGLTGEVVPAYRGNGAQLVPFSGAIERLLQPFTLNLDEWAEALFAVSEFPDQDPDDQTNALLASILLAESSDEALAAMEVSRAKQLCGDEPGGHSPLLVIFGARPLKSEFEQGPSCYIIIDAAIKATGERIRITTGAKAVQAAILAHMARGWIPFEAMLEIRRVATRRGFFPLNLVAGG